SNRSVLSRGDAFLQITHLGRERWLITDCARRASEQGRYFRTCLREAKDVIDKQKHILIFFVAEILCHGESGQGNSQPCARRLVHLPVDQRDFGFAETV